MDNELSILGPFCSWASKAMEILGEIKNRPPGYESFYEKLITRRSQVQVLPPQPKSPQDRMILRRFLWFSELFDCVPFCTFLPSLLLGECSNFYLVGHGKTRKRCRFMLSSVSLLICSVFKRSNSDSLAVMPAFSHMRYFMRQHTCCRPLQCC